MRMLVWVALLALAVPAAVSPQGQGPPRGREQAEAQADRRAQLERRVRQQFMAQVDRRLGLDAARSERLQAVLRSGAEERRALAIESQRLRLDLMEAVRSEQTPDTTFDRILAGLERLREAERTLERREEAALAEFLDARQRAMFLFMRMRFNEQVRQLQGRRGPGTGPGGGPAGGI